MIFQDALRSIKKDFSKAFFYWLIFVLTTMLIYLFFNISMSDPNVNPLNDTGNMITYVMLMVIILCSIDILFANDFYVKLKGKDMAVRLICGAKFYQIAGFLLFQTVLLLVLAAPVGIFLSYASIPVVNSVLAASNHGFVVTAHPDAILNATIILLYVVFWIILLNLSFAYRNAIGLLINPSTITNLHEEQIFRLPTIPKKLQQGTALAAFFVPLFLIYCNRGLSVVLSIVGMVGLNGCLSLVVTPWINRQINTRMVEHPRMIAVMGFVRRDLQVLKNNIFLFLVSAVVLVAMLVYSLDNDIAMMTIFLSYIVMTFLQALALMFKFGTEVSIRQRLFQTLNHIGYMYEDQKIIIHREVKYVYGFILVISFLYIFNILLAYTLAGDLSWQTSAVLLGGSVVPLILCGIITLSLYTKAVFPKAAHTEEDRISAE